MDAKNSCYNARSLIEAAKGTRMGALVMQLRVRSTPALPITWSAEKFLRKSSVTADCVAMLAEVLKAEDPDVAYLGGIFHDIGEAILAVGEPRTYDDIQAVSRITRRDILEIEREVLGWDHAALSAMVLRHWNLPSSICDSVEHHHKPESAPVEARQMALILKEADDYFTSKSIACMATDSFSLANLSVTNTCITYSPGGNFVPSESIPPA